MSFAFTELFEDDIPRARLMGIFLAVLELVRRVRAKVRQVKGVELEPEVLLYGRNWKDVL